MLQRRGGLHLSEAKVAHNLLEATLPQTLASKRVDRKGDGLTNAGEYNRRHNAVLRATHKAVAAVAVGACVLGDKEDIAKTAMLNADHAVDLAELGGDDANGSADMLYEIKVPSALVATYCAGNGSRENGGAPASVGHLYGFGSTQEKYEQQCDGCRERGRQRDGPLDHDTGKGWRLRDAGREHGRHHATRSQAALRARGARQGPRRH